MYPREVQTIYTTSLGGIYRAAGIAPAAGSYLLVESHYTNSPYRARSALSSILSDQLFQHLKTLSIITEEADGGYRSNIRISNFYLPQLGSREPTVFPSSYYVHSSFPASSDSVFFGPDTYLFVEFLRKTTTHLTKAPQSILDVCCGSGAGAIHMARMYPDAKTMGLDLNPRALSLGSVNAKLAGVRVEFCESDLYAALAETDSRMCTDVIVSNPPYIASSPKSKDLPLYADGGATFGLDISLRIVEEGMPLLSPQGVIVIYTGVAIPTADPGRDAFKEKLQTLQDVELVEYTVLHPDMWPEEIGLGAYADVCRIQVVGVVIRRKA